MWGLERQVGEALGDDQLRQVVHPVRAADEYVPPAAERAEHVEVVRRGHLDGPLPGQVREDLSGVLFPVEAVPGRGEELLHVGAGVFPEPGQELQCRLAAHADRRVHHSGRGAVVDAVLRAGQQSQHQIATGPRHFPRRLEGGRRNMGGQPVLHPPPHRRRHLGRVPQPGRRQQGPARGSQLRQPAQHLLRLLRSGMGEGEQDHVVPLVQVGVVDQQVEVHLLHGEPGPQVVLEGAVQEVHLALGGLAQQPGAQQQCAVDLLPTGVGQVQRGQRPVHDPERLVPVHLLPAVADQPPRQLLQQLHLRGIREAHPVGAVQLPFPVPAFQEHGQGGLVERPAVLGQETPPVPVQGAQHAAHERIGGQPVQLGGAPHGGEQGLADGLGHLGRPVPAPYEGGDAVAAHGGEDEFAEALGGQPRLRHRRGPRGDQPQVPGEGPHQLAQPAPGGGTAVLGDLVDAVDQQHPAPGPQHALHPPRRLLPGDGAADRAQEVAGNGQLGAGPHDPAHRQHERHPPDEVGQPVVVDPAGRRDREPLHERRLARPGDTAQEHLVVTGKHLLGGHGRVLRVPAPVPPGPRPRRLQAQVRRVQRPLPGAGVQPVDGERAVPGGDVVRVALLEPGVLGRLGRQPFQQDVDGPDQPGQLLRLDGLLAGDVGGALGEEVQDVQRGGVQQPLVQQRAALAEPVRGQGHAGAQLAGEALGAEPHGLVVLDGDLAEPGERAGQGVLDGRRLRGVHGLLAGSGRGQRPADQLSGDLVDVLGRDVPLLAPEGHQRRYPHRPVHEPRSRPVPDEEPADERYDRAGRDTGPECCDVDHAPSLGERPCAGAG